MADEKIFKSAELSDEELENVAGGTHLESADDAKKFKAIGVDVGAPEVLGVPVVTHDQFVKLREAFNQFGVTVKDHGGIEHGNEYFINGKLVSRDDAWKHINAQAKK